MLGFEKTSRKGKKLTCEPLPTVATDELRAALDHLTSPQPPAPGGDASDELGALERQLADVMAVRRMLASSWEAAPAERLQ